MFKSLSSLALLVSALANATAQEAQNTPHTHAPSVTVLDSDCGAIRDAAVKYLGRRGVNIVRHDDGLMPAWCTTSRCFDYYFIVHELLDEDRQPLTWEQIKQMYTRDGSKTIEHERESVWSGSRGYWEVGGRWSVGGILELRGQEKGCLVRIDFSYGRAIHQFLLFWPFDLYGQSLLSNNRLENESIAGIRRTAGIR